MSVGACNLMWFSTITLCPFPHLNPSPNLPPKDLVQQQRAGFPHPAGCWVTGGNCKPSKEAIHWKVGSCGGRILDLSCLVTFAIGPLTKNTLGHVQILLTDKS